MLLPSGASPACRHFASCPTARLSTALLCTACLPCLFCIPALPICHPCHAPWPQSDEGGPFIKTGATWNADMVSLSVVQHWLQAVNRRRCVQYKQRRWAGVSP